jgi:hypothetical protein
MPQISMIKSFFLLDVKKAGVLQPGKLLQSSLIYGGMAKTQPSCSFG